MTTPRQSAAFVAASLWLLALGASCTEPPPQPPSIPPRPIATGQPIVPAAATDQPAPAMPSCRLPAPVKGGDACATDADCGVSDPCHAHACVAKAKSRPKTPDTMCTMMMDCASADVNRCGCFEGRCSLIPPP
ncbi:MAG: hypothetical protein QM820_25505 [Minicystis sp.]